VNLENFRNSLPALLVSLVRDANKNTLFPQPAISRGIGQNHLLQWVIAHAGLSASRMLEDSQSFELPKTAATILINALEII
jgi:streptomycin 6-kinase